MKKENRIGEKIKNKQGDVAEIIEYKNSKNIKIKFFTKDFILNNIKYSDFKNGSVKNPFYPSICGVGYIGNIKNPTKCELYNTWVCLIKRTQKQEYLLKRKPTYYESRICDRWLCFEYFLEDYKQLLGYEDCVKKVLDKDLLSDSKLYSKDTCCLISNKLNTFFAMVSSNNKTGKTGVSYEKRGNCYISQIRFEDITVSKKFTFNENGLNEASLFYWKNKAKFLLELLKYEVDEIRNVAINKFIKIITNENLLKEHHLKICEFLNIESIKEINRVTSKTLEKK